MTVNHDVAGSSPAGGAKEKSRSHCGLLFLSFALIALNRQDIMIAQHVALSDVCEANSQLSGAIHCRWFEPSRGSKKHKTEANASVLCFFFFCSV